MSYQVINPFIQFVDPINGNPLSAGTVYFGRMDSDPKNQPANRINVYAVQDNGSEVLLSQPITLNGAGQPQYSGSVKQIKVENYAAEEAYAIQVFSKNGAQKSYSPRVYSTLDLSSGVSKSVLADPASTISIAGVAAPKVALITGNAELLVDNTSLGLYSFDNNTTGYSITAFGYETAEENTTGFNLTAVGRSAGRKNTTGINNTFVGVVSGTANTTGGGNTGLGVSSLTSCTTGDNNTTMGFKAGFSIVSGDRNTLVGTSAGELGTADDVTAVGFEAAAVGQGVGAAMFGRGAGINGTGTYNTGMGFQTQFATGNGFGNVSLGAFTLQGVANQSRNTALGYESLQYTTASDNTGVGARAGSLVTTETNVTCVGANSTVTNSNQVQLGDSATTTYAYGAVQDRSDIRDKLDVKALTDAHIAFFMDVEWRQYRMNYRERYAEIAEDGSVIELENDGSRAGSRYHIGAIAQQVDEAMKRHGIDFAGLQHHAFNGGKDVYTIGYAEFIGIQGEIIQRQQRAIASIEARLIAIGA